MSKNDWFSIYRYRFDPSNVHFSIFRVVHNDQSVSDVKTKFVPTTARSFSTQYKVMFKMLCNRIVHINEQLLCVAANAFKDCFLAPQTSVAIELEKSLFVVKNKGAHVGKRRFFKP